eukprot:SAG11_NODE_846_length_6884_cov_5.651732_10_plen_47_part_00
MTSSTMALTLLNCISLFSGPNSVSAAKPSPILDARAALLISSTKSS